MKEKVFRIIEEANEEDSKLYLEAAIRKRESFLNGGEILYREFSKKQVEERERIMRRIEAYRKQGYL